MRAVKIFAVLVLLSALAACGSDAEESGDTATEATSGECVYTTEGSAAKDAELPAADPVAVDALTLSTNRGDIELTFDAANAPCTVNSFASLAAQGYFDDTTCHRLVPGFVLQCGDPSGSGAGGPGYRFEDELTGEETYPAGTLAMANAGPDTNGSQFFIVLDDAALPPAYTVFGEVDAAGLEVAREIAADGNGPDGVAPAEDVVIESVS